MHEFALAEGVLRTVGRVADAEGLFRVTRVVVSVGELQGIRPETFSLAVEELRPAADARLEDAVFEIEVQPARFVCRQCDHPFELADTGARDAETGEAMHFVPELARAFLRCPHCGSRDIGIEEGRGVGIERIEGEAPDA